MNNKIIALSYAKTRSGGYIALPTACSQESYDEAANFKFDQHDVIICTFPKSGTTWMMNITWLIIHKGAPLHEGETLSDFVPFLEADGANLLLRNRVNDVTPRLYHTHLPRNQMTISEKAKTICVLRHPKDVCVSFYHHTVEYSNLYHFKGDFDDYFQLFDRGQTDFGDYFEHVKCWMESFAESNCFNVLYEDLVSDTKSVVMDLARFLGYEHHVSDPNDLETILQHCSFNYMAGNMTKFSRRIVDGKCPVIRKGIIGDWRNHMSEEQAKTIDEKCKKYGIDHLWGKYRHLF